MNIDTRTVPPPHPIIPQRPATLGRGVRRVLGRVDRVLWAVVAVYAVLTVLDPGRVPESLRFAAASLLNIAPFLLLSIAIAAAARATGSEKLIAGVFSGRPIGMVLAAAAFGSLSPFCSCGVIPIVAGLLGAGVPLAPVMAFWISSPLMDPQMFILTAAALGLPFAVGKTLAAFAIGLSGGLLTLAAQRMGWFPAPLREGVMGGCCNKTCGDAKSATAADDAVLWPFWREARRRHEFATALADAGWFLGKWLLLAFVLESLMIAYIPSDAIGQWLGGGAWWAIPAAVVVGVPAYMNGFAAIPLMAGLIDMGMDQGAAMAFMIAGGVTSIPAAIAVFALVRRHVFAWYVALSLSGSLAAGILWQLTVAA